MLLLLLWEPHQGRLLSSRFQLFRFWIACFELCPVFWSEDFGMYEVNKDKKENAVTPVSKSNGCGGNGSDKVTSSRWNVLPWGSKPTCDLPFPLPAPPSRVMSFTPQRGLSVCCYPFKGESLSMTEHSWKQHSENRIGADAKGLDRMRACLLGRWGARREQGAERTVKKEGQSTHSQTWKTPKTNFLDFLIWLRLALVHFLLW